MDKEKLCCNIRFKKAYSQISFGFIQKIKNSSIQYIHFLCLWYGVAYPILVSVEITATAIKMAVSVWMCMNGHNCFTQIAITSRWLYFTLSSISSPHPISSTSTSVSLPSSKLCVNRNIETWKLKLNITIVVFNCFKILYLCSHAWLKSSSHIIGSLWESSLLIGWEDSLILLLIWTS